jgi:hypothetical protein
MSTSLDFLAVDWNSLIHLFRSATPQQISSIIEKYDELFSPFEDADDEATEQAVRPEDAVRAILQGEPLVDFPMQSVRLAILALFQESGELFSIEGFQEFHSSYFDEVDQGLARIGLSDILNTNLLAGRGLPLPLDSLSNMLDMAGFILPTEAEAIIERIDGDTSAIYQEEGVDPMIAGAIEELLEMLAQTAEQGRVLLAIE